MIWAECSKRNKGTGEAKGPEKQRGRRNRGAGETKGPEKERGQRNKGAGEAKGLEKPKGLEKQRGSLKTVIAQNDLRAAYC
jgi:hypothetical protein